MENLSNKIAAVKAETAERVMKIIRDIKKGNNSQRKRTKKRKNSKNKNIYLHKAKNHNKNKNAKGAKGASNKKTGALAAVTANFEKLSYFIAKAKITHAKLRDELPAFSIRLKDCFKKIISAVKAEKRYRIAASAGFFLCIAAIIVFASSKSAAYEVKLDGKLIGYVKNVNEINRIIDSIEDEMSGKYGTEVDFSDGKLDFSKVKVSKIVPLDEEEIKEKLSKPEYYMASGWIITSNGKEAAACATKEEAQKLLESVKAYYKKQGIEYSDVYFKEKAEIKESAVSAERLTDGEEALKYILTGTKEQKQHIVSEGETFWSISKKYKMSVSELLAANPGANPDKIKIGQVLNLYFAKPYFTVVTVEKAAQNEQIAFGTEYEKTQALYRGEEKLKIKGEYGIKEIRKEIVRENGVEVASKVLSEKVVSEPQNQVILKGTKAVAGVGTGEIGRPTRGTLSSRFGGRWGRQHEGIDISGAKGTPIYAADSGVVVFAGRDGAYGNKITISHGNGMSTVYAHCSKLYVTNGEKVEKGQKIAAMGATGNATGVHLHFEVRKNGVPQNPLKYVNY